MSKFSLAPIVVPTDFSEASFAALSRALALVGGDSSQLHIVHVLFNLSAVEPGVVWGDIDDATRISRSTEVLREELGKRGAGQATVAVRNNPNPAKAITSYAKEVAAPLIVVAATGHTGVERLLLGSVAERIVRMADCDVLVVRPPEDTAS